MKKILKSSLLFGLLFLVLTACSPIISILGSSAHKPDEVPPGAQPQTSVREAQVQSVEIQITLAGPVQVYAIVRGVLSESCAQLGDTTVSYASNTFQIKIMTVSPSDRGCIQITNPFEQSIPLDTTDLEPGDYTVTANGVTTLFTLPSVSSQLVNELQLIVYSSDHTIQVVTARIPLSSAYNPVFNSMLLSGGSADGVAYALDTTNQAKVVSIDNNGIHELNFIKNPTTYGLAVWSASSGSQARLAWATQSTDSSPSSTIQISAPDGSQLETLLTLDSSETQLQLMAQFWSADGQELYFSKEPMGLGGYILFGGASNLYRINIKTKEVTDVIPMDPLKEAAGCLDSFSNDSRYVADHCSQNMIKIRDLATGGVSLILPPDGIATGHQLVGSARISPDGSHLAYAVARGDQGNEQGWVVVSHSAVSDSRVILTSQEGSYYTVAGWLNDQTLLVQSTNLQHCTPYCTSEVWVVGSDGSNPEKVADGSLITVVPDSSIALP